MHTLALIRVSCCQTISASCRRSHVKNPLRAAARRPLALRPITRTRRNAPLRPETSSSVDVLEPREAVTCAGDRIQVAVAVQVHGMNRFGDGTVVRDQVRRSEVAISVVILVPQDPAVESAEQVICRVTSEGTFLFLNQFAAEGLGATPEDLIGKSMYDLFPKKYADMNMSLITKALKSDSHVFEEYETEVHEGKRWYQVHIWPVHEPGEDIKSALIFANDVTSQKQTEQALVESERKYKILYEQKKPTQVNKVMIHLHLS